MCEHGYVNPRDCEFCEEERLSEEARAVIGELSADFFMRHQTELVDSTLWEHFKKEVLGE
jgi:hypothetical protein